MMMFCSVKNSSMSHVVDGQAADGVPQVDGSGVPEVISAGTLARCKAVQARASRAIQASQWHERQDEPPHSFTSHSQGRTKSGCHFHPTRSRIRLLRCWQTQART